MALKIERKCIPILFKKNGMIQVMNRADHKGAKFSPFSRQNVSIDPDRFLHLEQPSPMFRCMTHFCRERNSRVSKDCSVYF